jgi:hypothetical protein
MSTKEKPRVVGLLTKSRDELSATGSSAWFALFPGSRREGEDWVPDGDRPFRLLIVKQGQKTWLEALDIKVLIDLLEANKKDVEASYILAGVALENQIERLKSIQEK